MEKLDYEIERHAQQLDILRERLQVQARQLVDALESPDTSATSLHLKACAIEASAGVLFAVDAALRALRAAR